MDQAETLRKYNVKLQNQRDCLTNARVITKLRVGKAVVSVSQIHQLILLCQFQKNGKESNNNA